MEPVLVMFILQISLLVLCLVMFSDEKTLSTKIRSLLFLSKKNSNFDEFCEEKDEALPIELDFSVKDHLIDQEVASEATAQAVKENAAPPENKKRTPEPKKRSLRSFLSIKNQMAKSEDSPGRSSAPLKSQTTSEPFQTFENKAKLAVRAKLARLDRQKAKRGSRLFAIKELRDEHVSSSFCLD